MAKQKVAEAQQLEPNWDAMEPDQFADAVLAGMSAAPALLTCEEMDQLEKRWRGDMRARRCALVLLTKPGSDYVDMVAKDREFAEAAANIQQYVPQLIDFHEHMIKLFEQMNGRTAIALAGRQDMQELMDKAKAKYEAADQIEVADLGEHHG